MPARSFSETELFVIGASAGGVNILHHLLPAFRPTGKFKVVVVLHLPPGGPNLLTSLYDPICSLKVAEANPGEALVADTIYFSPTDYHLCIEPNHTLSLSSEEPVNFSRPSIDVLFESAAYAYGRKTAGILLTGANEDGSAGLKKIQEAGGIAVVQEPRDAEYEAMPLSALSIMKPDYVLTKLEIRDLLSDLCSGGESNA